MNKRTYKTLIGLIFLLYCVRIRAEDEIVTNMTNTTNTTNSINRTDESTNSISINNIEETLVEIKVKGGPNICLTRRELFCILWGYLTIAHRLELEHSGRKSKRDSNEITIIDDNNYESKYNEKISNSRN